MSELEGCGRVEVGQYAGKRAAGCVRCIGINTTIDTTD